MRELLAASAIAATAALLSCNAPPSGGSDASGSLAYEPSAPVVRTPLPPLPGYAAGSPSSPSDDRSAKAVEAAKLTWHASPRWAAINRKDALVDSDDPQIKFKAVQAKASKVGVENLSDKGVEGLSPAQLRELRGY